VEALTEPLSLPFMQRALSETALLALAGGLLGAWIVLRRLAFFAHAAGSATFPGLIAAGPLGIAPQLAALASALAFSAGLERAAHARRLHRQTATGLALVGTLALGALLASDAYGSSASVDTLLFGSLLGVSDADLWFSAGVGALALSGSLALGRAWLASGFDPAAARALGVRTALGDQLLSLAIAAAVVATLPAAGVLLVSALLVVPAATARLLAPTVRSLLAGAVALALVEGCGGLLLAYWLDAPPGPVIALLGGALFALVAVGRALGPRRGAAAAALVAALASGCASEDSTGEQRLRVVATTAQVADFVRQVGGERIELKRLTPANVDPHEFEPRPSDARAIAGAELVFRSGAGLDDWLGELAEQAGGGARRLDLSARVPLLGRDPHWWQDPRRAAIAVASIRRALSAADPAGRTVYSRRAALYSERLLTLDRHLERCVRRLGRRQRRLVTNHDSFAYLAQRYGLEPVGTVIPSRSSVGQTSSGELAELVSTIRRTGVRVVFAERSAPADVARNLARETGARVVASLYADALGPLGSRGATYLGALRADVEAIVDGLSGGALHCGGAP